MKEIDEIFSRIYTNSEYTILEEEAFNNYKEFIEYIKLINLLIEDYKLLKQPFSNRPFIALTKFGQEVVDKGGWLKYLENEKLKELEAKLKSNTEI